jgi:hypothetical protein
MSDRVEIDAREVLDRYIDLIKRTGGGGSQDVSALPASKAVIKAILMHVLRNAPKGSDLAPIKHAYLELAVFQDQRSAAVQTIDSWLERVSADAHSSMTDAELQVVAQKTVGVQSFMDSVEKKIEQERALLEAELIGAGL